MITKKKLLKLGFKKIPHFTIMDNYDYDLGRDRLLSMGNVGTPNEMMFIIQKNHDNEKIVDDLVCVHNYDYDGYMTEEKLKSLIFGLTGKEL